MADLPDPLTVSYQQHVLDNKAGLIEAMRIISGAIRRIEDQAGARNALIAVGAYAAVAAADDDHAESIRRRHAMARIGMLQKMRAAESAA